MLILVLPRMGKARPRALQIKRDYEVRPIEQSKHQDAPIVTGLNPRP